MWGRSFILVTKGVRVTIRAVVSIGWPAGLVDHCIWPSVSRGMAGLVSQGANGGAVLGLTHS